MCYPSTAQTLTNPANPPSPPNPTRHHLKNPAAHPLTPPHHPTRSTIQSTQPLPPPLSPQLSTSPTQKHLSNTSKTIPHTPPSIPHPPSAAPPSPQPAFLHSPLHANPCSHRLLHLLHTRLQPALNTFPSLTSNRHLHLLLCPNFTPRFRPFYLTSTHKHTTIKPPIKPP